MLAELTLATLTRTERALGPGAAITLVRAALETTDGELRRTLLLAGMGAALRADDASAFAGLASEWASASGGGDEKRGLSLVARLVAHGRLDAARKLARAEHERERSAESALALAATLEHEKPDEAAALLAESASRGPGDHVRRAALGHSGAERADEAEAELARSTDPRDAVRLAPSALSSGRLYTRVRVLDRLLDLTREPNLRPAVLRVALAFADRRGARLGELEHDRVIAIATRSGASAAVIDALAGRSTATDEAAARDALMGHAPRVELLDRASGVALRALASVAADDGSASLLLSALAAHAPSPAGWTAVHVGLSRPKPRAAAVSVVERWLNLGLAPPRGYGVLAGVLERAGSDALAERAWLEAVRACEPGARKRVGAALEARAHAAYAAGDRLTARALIERSLAIDPD